MSASNFFYNRLLNPAVRSLLRSPMHGLASGSIAILHFTGIRSGRSLNTPLSYTQEDETVRLLSNQNTRWWKNLRGVDVPVEMEIARQRLPGIARLYEGDSQALRDGVTRFINRLPRDAVIYGLKLDDRKQLIPESLETQIGDLVLVEILLSGH
ncbi:MAG: nitroreductase/quinone reductase family protein [Pseudomonadota bacterium]